MGIAVVAGCGPAGVDDDGGASAPLAVTQSADLDVSAVELPALELPPEDSSGTSAAPAPDPLVVERMAAGWDVSPEGGALRLRLQDGDAELVAALRSRHPELFAGRSVGSHGESVYAFTADAPNLEAAIIEIHADAGIGPEHVVFEILPFSQAELDARQDRATQAMSLHAGRFGITTWGVGTDSETGTSYVNLDAPNLDLEAAVRADLDHDVVFRTGGALTPAG